MPHFPLVVYCFVLFTPILETVGQIQTSLSKPLETCLTSSVYDNRYASYSLSGDLIAFESNRDGGWQVYVMDKAGKNVRQITNGEVEHRRPSWHPNGQQLLVEKIRAGFAELILVDIYSKSKQKINLNNQFKAPLFAKYAASGDKIAFSAKAEDSLHHLFIFELLSNKQISIVKSKEKIHFPNWSPTTNRLAFFSRKDTEGQDDEIYELNLNTKKITRLTVLPKHNFCPSYSPNGKLIAFASSMEKNRPEIFIMNHSGKKMRRITFNENGDTLPNWHPSGDHLLITAFRGEHFQICKIALKP